MKIYNDKKTFPVDNGRNGFSFETLGNPVHEEAFSIDNNAKIVLIQEKFKEILHILGMNLTDDSIRETPKRIAKMYVQEIFSGLDPNNKPEITLFENKYNYTSSLLELNIPFTSFCEHHFVPIIGKVNMAYIPNKWVIGLSKIHRLVDYFARRPQIQERLTNQISQGLAEVLQTENVGVVVKASHSCISCRGVQDLGSSTVTSSFFGEIPEKEFLFEFN